MLQVTNLVSSHVVTWLSQFDREEEGQGLVEYALIIVLVSIASILALTALGGQITDVFTKITGELAK
jgi:pilus assembly protein Flp/PilA